MSARQNASGKASATAFYYSRLSNPTLRQLELALSDLQERDGCLLTASGIGAIAIPLLTLLKAGDHVAYCAEMYGPRRALIRRVLGRFGVTSTILSIEDLDGPQAVVRIAADADVRVRVADEPGAQGSPISSGSRRSRSVTAC
jgi:cystathionine beta-lyase/cystathionine gamma-synthase